MVYVHMHAYAYVHMHVYVMCYVLCVRVLLQWQTIQGPGERSITKLSARREMIAAANGGGSEGG